jgi:hypothetical protein
MTAGGTSDVHVAAEVLLDYFGGKVGEARERSVEEHLGSCALCAALAREVCAFNEVWQWPAEVHGRLQARRLLAQALAVAASETADAGWRRRLQGWRREWSGRAEAALHVVLELTDDAARAAGRALDSLARPDAEWRFAAEPAPAAVRGPAGEESGSAILTTAVTPGKPRARIAVHAGERGEIVVRLDDLPSQASSPLVLLISIGGALTVRVAEAAARPGRAYRIARFTDVAPGEYVVAFEPRS